MKHLYSTLCRKLTVCLTVLLLTTLAVTAQQKAVSLAGTNVTNSGGYLEYVPPSYASSKESFPLLIFIHGIGELGNGTTQLPNLLLSAVPKRINNGTFPTVIKVKGKSFSFIVASPQFKKIPSPADVLSLINYLKRKFRIDDKRIYITGLSMGGGVTEDFASASDSYAQIPAAVVAVAGNMNPRQITNAPKVMARNDVPVWFIHNDRDPTVPSQYSLDWVSMMKAYSPAPNPAPKLTIFSSKSHDAWTTAYDPSYKENGMNIYEWMLQYEKGKPVTDPPNTTPPPGNKKVIAKTNVGNGMWYTDAMSAFKLKPGDTLCILGGDYEFIQLGNLVGTAAKPIVITNCGGVVRTGIKTLKSDVSFGIMGGKFLEISGSGTPGVEYGFDISGRNLVGVKMQGVYLGSGSTDINIHNFYVHDVGSFMVAKTTQECNNPQFWEGKYVMKNVKIHHIKGRYSDYEGFYIGNTHYTMDYLLCKGIKSHHLQDLEVYDNDLQYMGQDGIQVSMADMGENKVHHNLVRNYGTSKLDAQSYGLLMGGGSRVKLYNNVVDNGYLPGIALFGSGISYVYNNTISNIANGEGITVADKLVLEPVTAYIYNNTIYNSGNTGITIYAYLTTKGHKVYNNLVIEKSRGGSYPSDGLYIRGAKNIKFDYGNNLFSTIANAGKVVANVANGDFHLTASSTSIDAGKSVADLGLTTDLDDDKRPTNGGYDVGAYEYQGPKTPPKGNVAPVANAGKDITITLPTNTVTLDGNASSDSDGRVSKYAWKKQSGPAGGTITNGATATTSVTGLTAGTYIFTLTITDDKSATDLDSITVKVNPAASVNKPPVASAGSTVTVTLPTNTATLDGSASKDPDGSISKYAWKKVSGPTGGTITSATAAKTTITGLTAGSYVFSLTVTDNKQSTNTANVTVTVKAATNKAPLADAGTNTTITLPTNKVTLDGSASKDPDGSISKYVWTKVSGPAGGTITTAGAAKTTVTGLTAGSYIFSLTVTDNKQSTNTARVTIRVNPASNKAPVADAGTNTTITLPTSTVILDGSASTDPDGKITQYAWKKVSGPGAGTLSKPDAARISANNLVAGTYVFSLTVTDDEKATATATVTVTVRPAGQPNKAPVASAGPDVNITLPNTTAILDGSGSKDSDGKIVKYAWSKISGPNGWTFTQSNVATTKAIRLVPGTYLLALTVTDDDNATDTDTMRVVVKDVDVTPPPANKAPVANAGTDVTITLPVNSVILNGAGSSDPDGVITNYQWLKTSGKDVHFSNAQGIINVVSGLTEGTYEFELVVTDNSKATASNRLTVTVRPAKASDDLAPVSRTQGDLTIKLPVSTFNADGSRSYANNANITNYAWKQVYGPLQATIATPAARSTQISGLAFPGSYVFELVVTDDNKLSSRSTFEVTVIDADGDAFVPEIATYPNPVVNTLYFKQRMKNATQGTITIFNMSGTAMKAYALPAADNAQQALDVTSLPAGTYILQVTYKNSSYKWSTKIIKTN